MTWSSYGTYLLISIGLVLVPGPDTFLVLRATLAGGRGIGLVSASGVFLANAVQGMAAAFGLGVLIARSHTAFAVLRWAGVAYLCFLGAQAIVAAVRGRYAEYAAVGGERRRPGRAFAAGFLSNITNPKVLVMYLSVLPQFLDPVRASTFDALLLALTVAVLGVAWLAVLVLAVQRARRWLSSRRTRRGLDATAGAAFVGFGGALALSG